MSDEPETTEGEEAPSPLTPPEAPPQPQALPEWIAAEVGRLYLETVQLRRVVADLLAKAAPEPEEPDEPEEEPPPVVGSEP